MPSQSPLRDGIGPGFDLIETLCWEPHWGFVRLERHLARLAASARDLGFAHDARSVIEALDAFGLTQAQRVRLALAFDGKVTVLTQPFEPLPMGKEWALRIAGTRLHSGDPLLRHKTTRRDAYQRARAEFMPTEADEVLLLNERGELCEGTITNLFVDMGDGGPLLTPPLSCGLLAGVLRGALLDDGKASETVLSPAELSGAKALFVGNSLRGLIPACLADD
jgi:4-amino-4-deoxychorismate lyase